MNFLISNAPVFVSVMAKRSLQFIRKFWLKGVHRGIFLFSCISPSPRCDPLFIDCRGDLDLPNCVEFFLLKRDNKKCTPII